MAAPDDDIERLLKEVEAALGPPATGGSNASASSGQSAPARRSDDGSSAANADKGAIERVRDGVPVAVAVGAVSGAVVWGVFTIVPFVSGLSGALGAFIGAAGVSLAGRLRRR